MNTYESVIKNLGYFQIQSRSIFSFLKTNEDIKLNFSGYTETVSKSQNIGNMTFDELGLFVKELNAWLSYFNEIYCVIKKMLLTYENRTLYLAAYVNPARQNIKLQKMIEENNNKQNIVCTYVKSLFEQIQMLNLLLKQTTYILNESIKKYNR